MSILILALISFVYLISILLFGIIRKKTKLLYWRRIFVVAVLIFLMITTTYLPLGVNETQDISNRDILFISDVSYSMNAEDSRDNKSRIDVMKEDMLTIARLNEGARFGIVSVDTTPTIYLPTTTSISDLEIATQTLSTKDYYSSKGKSPSFSEAFERTKKYLEDNNKVDASRETVLVIMTDAEITNKDENEEEITKKLEELKKLAGGFVVLGYGSKDGSKMKIRVYNFDTKEVEISPYSSVYAEGILPDGSFGEYITKFNEETATKFANTLGGRYVSSGSPGDIESAIKSESRDAFIGKTKSTQSKASRQSIAYVFVAMLLFIWLLFVEVSKKRAFIKNFMNEKKQ